jgi:Rv0078B-related antitoxin
MTPQAALDMQIEMYRRMTPEQRLELALDLHELSCEVAREGIRHQFPQADEAEVERHLRHRLELARQT